MIASPIGCEFHSLPSIDSTNLHAMRQIHARMAEHGTVFFTTHQTAGRGQRGKQWHGNPNDNLALSAVLRTQDLAKTHQFKLSAAMALATRQLVANHINQAVSIKWPNDIYVGSKKIAGILIENIIQAATWRWSVVGLGLNVNQTKFGPNLPWATSAQMLTGQSFSPEQLAVHWCTFAQKQWERIFGPDSNDIVTEYNQHLYGINTIQRLKKDNVVIPCLIKRVTLQGVLVAGEHDEWAFEHGAVEWLR
ncbi:MAG: biotin--[acetyl-CoA-carboxylase] ligase [Bacteroidetes bacterium]|nr:MAG: biotin--[acetyl-CoA-carboxylase] ligase [Bacteroidota bacterium]